VGETKGCPEKSISSNSENTEEVTPVKNQRGLSDVGDLLLDGSCRMLIVWENLFRRKDA